MNTRDRVGSMDELISFAAMIKNLDLWKGERGDILLKFGALVALLPPDSLL